MSNSFVFQKREAKNIIIHNLTVLPKDDFVTSCIAGNHPVGFWCNGVLHKVSGFPPNDDLTLRLVEGKEEHWFTVFVAPMPEYEYEIKNKHGNSIMVVKSYSKVYLELIEWIKEQTEWKEFNGQKD